MKRVYPPAYLSLDDIDLQDDAAPYDSPILFVGNQFQWNAFFHVDVTGTAATTGLAKITVTFFDDEAGTNTVAAKDLLVDINTKVDGQEALSFGATGISHDGSGTPDAGGDAYSVGGDYMQVSVTVTEVNNSGTSGVGNLWLVAEVARPE